MINRKRLTLAAIVAASFTVSAEASAQEFKLTFADQNSPNAWGPSHAIRPWIKQVEQVTNGRVSFEVYPSQTLLKGVDMWKGVRSGTADIGWCVQGYWAEQTPLSDVISLPFLPINSAERGSEILWKLYEKFPSIQKEYDDIQPLVLHTSTNLLASKKPVITLDDMKGLKMRVLGGPPSEMARALGAEPALVPMPDLYQALDKGAVNAAAAPWEAVNAFRLYEVAKHFAMVPLYASYYSVCANKQKWESLPKDVRGQIMSVSGLTGAKFWGKNWFDNAEDGVLERARAGSYEVVRNQIAPDEAARWRKVAGEPLWNAWVAKMEAKGHPEASDILNTTMELLKD